MLRVFSSLSLCLFAACAGVAPPAPDAFDPVTMDAPPAEPPATNVELALPSHGERLPAYLMLAGGPGPHPTVLLLHGYPGNEKNLDLAQALRRASVNVLFLHYRGAWGAEGEFSIAAMPEDALAALDFLRAHAAEYRVDPARLAVVGHSMGGFAALHTAARDDRVRCAVGLAAANLGAYASRPAARQAGFADYSDGLFMLSGWTGAKALEELGANAAAFELGSLAPALAGRPVLLVTGRQDTVVPPDVQRALVERWAGDGGPRVTALEIGGDHSFAGQRIALTRTVIDWMLPTCFTEAMQ